MKKISKALAIGLLMAVSANIHSQEETKIIYLDQMFEVSANQQSPYKLELKHLAGNTYSGVVYGFMNSIKAKGTYVFTAGKYLEDGHFTYYHNNGLIESEGEFDRGVKVGKWKRYDSYGKRKSDRYYPAESADKIRETMMMEKEE